MVSMRAHQARAQGRPKGREESVMFRLPGRLYRVVAVLCLILSSCSTVGKDRDTWQQPDRIISDLGMKPGTKVADIGCGEGYFALRLAKSVGGQGLVFAVDTDAGALDALKKRAEREHLTNIVAVVSESTDTKLQPESVDMLFVCDVLHEVPGAQRLPLLKNAVRALTSGGFLYLIDWRKSRDVKFDSYEKLIPREDLIGICTDAGLQLDEEFHYLKYQVFLRFQKPIR